jgi:hypothetical protein
MIGLSKYVTKNIEEMINFLTQNSIEQFGNGR